MSNPKDFEELRDVPEEEAKELFQRTHGKVYDRLFGWVMAWMGLTLLVIYAITIPLAGQISRLEMLGGGRWFEPLAAILCIATAFSSMLVGGYWFRHQHRREVWTKLAGYCDQCGYDLTGNTTGRCPECGTVQKPKRSRRVVGRRDTNT